ncbi:MAG: polysaccharide export protein [Proteobacteria bacterium]|nr:polysaccharide export protein [Pseudomonadota bacterium]
MFLRIRYVIVSGIFALLPLATNAQSLGQDSSALQRGSGGISQGQSSLVPSTSGAGSASPSTGVVSPSIGNASVQPRQRAGQTIDPRTGQPIDARTGQPIIDLRTGQPYQQEIQLPLERIEFQNFVVESTGRDLPIFGSELFKNVPSTFAPVDDIPVTSDYAIGPGDEILIRAWGQLNVDYSAVVERTGTISIPKVGTINVAGIKYQDLQAHLKTAIGRVFRNFDLTVSLGQLRAIQVFVVGQARRPGSYTVSSMSTLVNTVFAAGGPSAKGSMRAIQLKRGNKVVTELDLYDLLISGDKSKDAPLLPGDVIYVPPVGALVAISGSVNVPAIFELKKDGALGDLIAWAGGLASTASGQRATIERIDSRRTRKVDEFNLDATGTQARLRDGDLVTIYSVVPRFDNAVSLHGNVAQPGRFPWRQGMRVKDLIPQVEALISRDYWLRKNQTVGLDNSIEELLKRNQAAGVNISVTELLKKNQQTQQQEADATVAESMRRTQIAADVVTANADPLKKLQRQQELALLRNQTQAGTSQPGASQFGDSTTTLRRGGTSSLGIGQGDQASPQDKDKPRTKLADEIKRNLSEINWGYAVIERLNPKDLTTTLVPFNLGRAILESDPAHNILLQPGDVVTIFSIDDIQAPIANQTKYARLEGEFRNAGIYAVEPGESLRQLVSRVGGFSPNAYLFGAELTRESTRVFQQKQLDETINRLEREMQRSSISRSKNLTSAEEAAGLGPESAAQQGLIARLRQIKAQGRIVLELPSDFAAGLTDLPDLTLEDGDRFTVPSRPSMVGVVGAVYNESAFIYRQEKQLADYLRQAGGISKFGDKKDVYVLRADGTVLSKRQSDGLMSSFDSTRLMPGDTIVVPEAVDGITWTKVLKDWGQILYQFGLGAAAFKVLQQ